MAGSERARTSRVLEIRLALSSDAARVLSEARLRRLLEIELGEDGVLAQGTAGPPGDHVAYVWVDRPGATRLGVEVRVADRPVARREIPIAGVGTDVATRLVALAAAETMREKPPARGPTTTPRLAAAELELATRTRPALSLSATGTAVALPSLSGGLGGPGVGLSFRALGASEGLFARWLQGADPLGKVRWLEMGVAAEYRHWLGPSWRVAGGGLASLASVRLFEAAAVDGTADAQDTWSARAGASLGVERRLASSLWLGLAFEPAVILRPVRYVRSAGAADSVEGMWLGLSLGLHFDRLLYGTGARRGTDTCIERLTSP